jgi:hypothetical protein
MFSNTPRAGRSRRRTTTLKAALLAGLALLAVPAGASASAIFNGDFETGSFSQYPLQQWCASNPNAAKVYSPASQGTWPAPTQGNHGVRFQVRDSDRSPCTPTGNPRAQVSSGKMLQQDREYWESFDVQFPTNFPAVPSGGWYLFQEDYSEPWNGSPALGWGIHNVGGAQRLTLDRGAQYGYDAIWSAPLTTGKWNRFIVHKKFAKNSSGFVEFWLNGVKQTFKDGSTKKFTQTMHSDQSGAGRFFINSYRKAGSMTGAVDSYFDNVRVGTTRADVDPTGGARAPDPGPAPAPVTAAFTYAPSAPAAGTPVAFDASASGPAAAYDWSLDGLTKLTGVKPSFTFRNPGTKKVTLTVTDAKGAKTSVTRDVVVR